MEWPIVYARATCIISHAGATVRLKENEVFAADDPLVKARPDLFSEKPVTVRRTAPVEEATAVPGERRRRG